MARLLLNRIRAGDRLREREAVMIILKNILVATDFSEPSAKALAYGRDLARSYNADAPPAARH